MGLANVKQLETFALIHGVLQTFALCKLQRKVHIYRRFKTESWFNLMICLLMLGDAKKIRKLQVELDLSLLALLVL